MNVCCASARAMLLLVCVDVNRSPLAQMEEERREHVVKMSKMEMEMEQVFEMKVKEKIQKLRDSESEVPPTINWRQFLLCILHKWVWVHSAGVVSSVQLQRRHEQMKKNLEAQHKELEEKRRQLEEEKFGWEAQQRMLEQQKLDSSRYTMLTKTQQSSADNPSELRKEELHMPPLWIRKFHNALHQA